MGPMRARYIGVFPRAHRRPWLEYGKPRLPGRLAGLTQKCEALLGSSPFLADFLRRDWRHSGEAKRGRLAHDIGVFRRDRRRPSLEYGKPRRPGRDSGRRRESEKRRSDLRSFLRRDWRHSGEAKRGRLAHDIGVFRRDRRRPSLEYGKPRLPGRDSGRRRESEKRRSDLRSFLRRDWRHSGEAKRGRLAHDIGVFRRDRRRPSLEYGKTASAGAGFGTPTRK
ncbi:hypothetical protein MRX96_041694 [Rhipicephalus microplus]